MNLSPHYSEIKSRALEILNNPEGWSFVGRGKIDSRKDSKLTAREFLAGRSQIVAGRRSALRWTWRGTRFTNGWRAPRNEARGLWCGSA